MADVALPPTGTQRVVLLLCLLCCLVVGSVASDPDAGDSVCGPLCPKGVNWCKASCMVHTSDGNMTAGACCSERHDVINPQTRVRETWWAHYCCVGHTPGQWCGVSRAECPLYPQGGDIDGKTIGIIIGSLAGAFIAVACCFICYKRYDWHSCRRRCRNFCCWRTSKENVDVNSEYGAL